MPASQPVHDTLGTLFIGTVLASIIYGITSLQVYYYYNSHSSRDRLSLKYFVAFMMLVDSTNVFFIIYTTYHIGVTNFGDYRSNQFTPWSFPAIALSGVVLAVSVQQFYVFRIYRLSGGSPYLPAAIFCNSLTVLGLALVYCTKVLQHIHEPGVHFQDISIATLSCKVLCDILITAGMVYTLLSSRTYYVKRTDSVLNLLAIYAINCGTLNLVFTISCVVLLSKFPDALIYAPSFFVMMRLYFCAFISILNSRDNLRSTLDGSEGHVITLSQLRARTVTTVPCGVQDTVGECTNTTVLKHLQPVSVSNDTSFSESSPSTTEKGTQYPLQPGS